MREQLACLPRLRHDLEVIPFEEDGEQFLLLRDPQGYGKNPVILHSAAWLILGMCDGETSLQQIVETVKREAHVVVQPEHVETLLDGLDRELLLDTPRFQEVRREEDARYQALTIREAAHAGTSYPDDPDELRLFFGKLFAQNGLEIRQRNIAGVITPHIDLQVGPQVYVPAIRSLEQADFDTIVILGTSHYSLEDLFLLTEKDYETPLGHVRTDRDLVRAIHEHSGHAFTKNDVAHRREHSIEFPLLFLQYLFGNDRLRILPVLVTSFEEYLDRDMHPSEDERYRLFLDAFQKTILHLGRKVVYVLSVDWSHVGFKFGDDRPAHELLQVIEKSDRLQLHALEHVNYRKFYDMLFSTRNATRIDGFSCITTFFDLAQPTGGKVLAYEQWHEVERQSAVSFASMAFFS